MATIETNNSLLKTLILHFYKGNIIFSLKPDDVEKMDWSWQQSFLDATINSKLLKKYPVSNQLIKLFLKKIVDYLEPSQEVHDDLYAQLCIAMKDSHQDGFCYRHYVIGKDLNNIVTMKETRNMVVNGTTGLKTWEAALMLSDWAICNKDMFSNKNIVELGSGVGFAGITIGKMCDVKSLLLTDCHDDVLKTVTENIETNFSHFKKEEINNTVFYESETTSIGVSMLDWNNIEHVTSRTVPDILIGADIVYDPTILQPLCNVIHAFCNKNNNLEAYIASVIRNEETFQGFLETLDNMDLKWEKIEITKSLFIEWDENIKKCLLKIKLKS